MKMTLKKWKIISVFLIFGLSSLFHFIYDLNISNFTAFFFPVNESIWEHNKIIFLSFLTLTICEKLYYKKRKNVLYSGILSSCICSIINMLIFTPIYLYILKTNDNMIITFIIFFIAIIISEFINYKLLNEKYNTLKEYIGVLLWIAIFILNGVLTYYPPNLSIFYDFTNKVYGRKM